MSGDFRIGLINQLTGPGASYADTASVIGTGCRPLEPLRDEDVRRIVREELQKLLADRAAVNGSSAPEAQS